MFNLAKWQRAWNRAALERERHLETDNSADRERLTYACQMIGWLQLFLILSLSRLENATVRAWPLSDLSDLVEAAQMVAGLDDSAPALWPHQWVPNRPDACWEWFVCENCGATLDYDGFHHPEKGA